MRFESFALIAAAQKAADGETGPKCLRAAVIKYIRILMDLDSVSASSDILKH